MIKIPKQHIKTQIKKISNQTDSFLSQGLLLPKISHKLTDNVLSNTATANKPTNDPKHKQNSSAEVLIVVGACSFIMVHIVQSESSCTLITYRRNTYSTNKDALYMKLKQRTMYTDVQFEARKQSVSSKHTGRTT